jgi:hypothetical protein
MTQALSELRAPVPNEALRLRMVALHGREDPLLDASRFQRLLRQANDAEVADVRKVGDDEYEISPHRMGGGPPPSAPTRESAAPAPAAGGEPAAAEAGEAAARENGQRFGVRFRRGSRAPLRTGEIPLIGVVEIEAPEPAAATAVAEPEEEAAAPVAKKPRRTRAPRKKASAAPATNAAPAVGEVPAEAPAGRPRRPRARAKKKAE